MNEFTDSKQNHDKNLSFKNYKKIKTWWEKTKTLVTSSIFFFPCSVFKPLLSQGLCKRVLIENVRVLGLDLTATDCIIHYFTWFQMGKRTV